MEVAVGSKTGKRTGYQDHVYFVINTAVGVGWERNG